jgi:hypothetical protein
MTVTFDPAKNANNIAERGLSFQLVDSIDWGNAVIVEDTRKDYGERRFRVFGTIRGRLHVAVITSRGKVAHIISFRKGNAREVREHGNK